MKYNLNDFVDPNKTNVLIHAGDCTNLGKEHEIIEFIYWFQNLKGFDDKIFIAGNHDFAFEEEPVWLMHYINEKNLSQSNCVYLQDNEYVINNPEFSRPIKIYGSPWQPEFYNWAFNLKRNSNELLEKWNKIPDDTDIIVTHGPAFGCLDVTPHNSRVGCELLDYRIKQIKPLIHVCGHIHHSHGIIERENVVYVNASICNERYVPKNKPIVVELTEYSGEIIVSHID